VGKLITWLHLSDLHAWQRSNWDSNLVLEPLLLDLKRMESDHQLQPDFLFFTGDVAFGQMADKDGDRLKDQYVLARTFLSRVCTIFKNEIPSTRVFIVPGNHDVNRKEAEAFPQLAPWLEEAKIDEVFAMMGTAGSPWKAHMKRLSR